MSDGTKIEWTDATVNAVNGCSVVSPGCTNCYAMRLAGTRLRNHPSRVGLTTATKCGPVWNGDVRLNKSALLQPLRWRRPRAIFWNAHGDLFHPKVPDAWIDWQFAVMALTPQHIHQVLTKRHDRMRAYFTSLPNRDDHIREAARSIGCTLMDCRDAAVAARSGMENLPHIWLGVSVEDQQRADERIPDLLATPAAGRFLSCEPLIGEVDLTRCCVGVGEGEGEWVGKTIRLNVDALAGAKSLNWKGLDWVICGGESGPGARPMHPDWARSLRDQCAAAAVPFFFKQWGEYRPSPLGTERLLINVREDGTWVRGVGLIETCEALMARVGKKAAGRLLDGATHDGMPA